MSESDPSASLGNERRLQALRRAGLLDTAPEEEFDRLTRLTCRLLGVPMALVSLVAADRQFFKSAVGLPEPWATRRETSLLHSFCQHVVATGAPLLVQEATRHPLVSENLAVPELGVMAYLGMPLATAEGEVLGTLCAIDTAPRAWTAADARVLQDLATVVMSEVSLRQLTAELRAQLAEARRFDTVGRLVTGVMDDLRGVLEAVRSGVYLAGRHVERDPAIARWLLDVVDDVAERGASLTRRLLAFTREEDRKGEPIEVAALLTGLREVLEPMLGEGVTVRLDVAPALPPLRASKGQLHGALVSVAATLREAMPEGGALTLAAAAEEVTEARGGAPHLAGPLPGRYVRLSVTGTGVDPEASAGARTPLFGLSGQGLGLAMARDAAERAGGGLALASEPGRGTTVSLWLPQAGTAAPPTGP